MCHADSSRFLGAPATHRDTFSTVHLLRFGSDSATRRVAVLPDIYGTTPFYRSFTSFLAKSDAERSRDGARVDLVNPWQPFGELPEPTREAAYERRHQLRDRAFCDSLERYVERELIDTVVGFCIGGNFAFELARRGTRARLCAVYPLPWGMPNEDGLAPAFEYMAALRQNMTVVMGANDSLAGPENIERLRTLCAENPALELHLYEGSGHGFLSDLDGEPGPRRSNAVAALEVVVASVFPSHQSVASSSS